MKIGFVTVLVLVCLEGAFGELSDKESERIGKVISDEVAPITQRLDDVEKHVAEIRRELRIIWILLFFIVSGLIILGLFGRKGKPADLNRIARYSAMQKGAMESRNHRRKGFFG